MPSAPSLRAAGDPCEFLPPLCRVLGPGADMRRSDRAAHGHLLFEDDAMKEIPWLASDLLLCAFFVVVVFLTATSFFG